MVQKLKDLFQKLIFIKPTNNLIQKQKTREELRDLALEMGFPDIPE